MSAEAGDSAEATDSTEQAEVIGTDEDAMEDGSIAAQVARIEAQKEQIIEAGKKEAPASETDTKKAEPEEGGEKSPAEDSDLRAKYEALKEQMEQMRTLHERENFVRDNGLPVEYASFIGGDKESWQGKLDMLLALRGTVEKPTSVPRDPALDAELSTVNTDVQEAREFFGL